MFLTVSDLPNLDIDLYYFTHDFITWFFFVT